MHKGSIHSILFYKYENKTIKGFKEIILAFEGPFVSYKLSKYVKTCFPSKLKITPQYPYEA